MYSRKVKILAFFAFGGLYFAFQAGPQADQTTSLILWAVGITLLIITGSCAHAERRAAQGRRDSLAQQVAEETELGNIPFVLYLRPFGLEEFFRTWGTEYDVMDNLFLDGVKMNFDYHVQTELSHLDLLLISIGPPNDKQGAGHMVTTDSLWRERFRQLAERARTIIVVPGIQTGITAEIRWLIVSGLLVNAVFFKPRGYPRAAWEQMQVQYENEEDIELPDYSPNQVSFRIYSSGRCYDVFIWRTSYLRSKNGKAHLRALLNNKPIDS